MTHNQVQKKQSGKPKLKSVIRKYLSEDCHILPDKKDKSYEFVFEVKYPKLFDKEGKQRGNMIGIAKPKNKNYFEILNRIQLPEEPLALFNNFDEKKKSQITWELRAFLISQGLLQSVNIENNAITFLDKLYFISTETIRINDLYHSIMKVINAQIIFMNILASMLPVNNNNTLNLKSEDSYYK